MIQHLEPLLENFDLKIILVKKGNLVSTAIVPSLKAGKTVEKLTPITASGTAAQLDEILANLSEEIQKTQGQRIYNTQAFADSLQKAESKAEDAAKAGAKKSGKEDPKPSKPAPAAPAPVAKKPEPAKQDIFTQPAILAPNTEPISAETVKAAMESLGMEEEPSAVDEVNDLLMDL